MAETRTPFSAIYNRFLEKITDDMYIELTPQDTLKDLRNLLIDAIPGFEFPRCNLYDYNIEIEVKKEDEVTEEEFIIGVIWNDLGEGSEQDEVPSVYIEKSSFASSLTSEEINILA